MTITEAKDFAAESSAGKHFQILDKRWGYVVRGSDGERLSIWLAQLACFALGVLCMTFSFGTFALPALFFAGDLEALRLGSAILFGSMGLYLLWFASRGTLTEVQLDLDRCEVREVIVNRAGPPTSVGTYAFDTIGGVFIEPSDEAGLSALVLRYRNTTHLVPIAEGAPEELRPLQQRIARDVQCSVHDGIGQPAFA